MTKLNLALVPTGWRAIVGAAVAKIDEIGEPWKTVVLSDRMACLDWRVRTESAAIRSIVNDAIADSEHTCMACGATGPDAGVQVATDSIGWLYTVCRQCLAEPEEVTRSRI